MRNLISATRARVHIPVPVILLAILLSIVVCSAFAENAPKLVIANDAHYSTSLLATAQDDISAEIAPCIIGGTGAGVMFDIPAGGAALVRNVGESFSSCTDEAIYLVDAPDSIDVQSIIRFADESSHASFIVGAIGAITPTSTTRVGPLVSDAEEGAWITVFPTHEGPVSIRLLDATGHEPHIRETFWATPPVTQYRVEAQGLFMADVSIGGDFGCLPYSCSDVGTIYGFASSGTPDGGTFRSFPFVGTGAALLSRPSTRSVLDGRVPRSLPPTRLR